MRTVHLTGLDSKGKMYIAGYHQGWIKIGRNEILGWLSYVHSEMRFTPYGRDEAARYKKSRETTFRPHPTAEDHNNRYRD